MATFNNRGTRPRVQSPVTTTGPALTALGASGFERSPLSDLYLLSVSNLVTAKTFHEGTDERNERYIDLLHNAAALYRDDVTAMLPWLRSDGYMRTASVLGAAEAAKSLCDQHRYEGVEDMVDGVLQRADELGEFLAYWFSIAGKAWPKRYRVVKQGLKRAATRLITEYSYGKYDSAEREYRFADILRIVHPSPSAPWQDALFAYILAKKAGRSGDTSLLPMVAAAKRWHRASQTSSQVAELLDPAFIKEAGLTWQNVLSGLGGRVDRKELWSAIVPTMPVGALLQNLRNLDEAGIGDDVAAYVCGVISDSERVRRARVFPSAFLSAYRAAPSLRWGHALEKGLAASLELVPGLRGKTLILVDRSPSMFPGHDFSTPNKSTITLADQAALFGTALAVKGQDVTLVEFGGESRRVTVPRGASVLKTVDTFTPDGINYTDIPKAVKDNFTKDYQRVVIITDEQSRPGHFRILDRSRGYGRVQEVQIDDLIPADVPVYVWNMAGYSASVLDASKPNRHSFGGLSDSSFALIEELENRRNAPWPWRAKKRQASRA